MENRIINSKTLIWEDRATIIPYQRITKTVETETNIYIEIDGGLITLQKDKCTNGILEFLREKCRESLSVTQKKKVIENVNNPEVLRVVMIILFVLTCICIPLTLSIINKGNGNQNPFEVLKNYWIFWLWLPIPILSIVLGFKYRKVRNAYDANIIVGFIVGILLSLFGCFCFTQIVDEEFDEFFNQEETINDEETCSLIDDKLT